MLIFQGVVVNFHVNLHVFRSTKLDPLPVVSRVSYNSTSRGYFTPVTHVFSAIFFRGPITPLTPGVGKKPCTTMEYIRLFSQGVYVGSLVFQSYLPVAPQPA